MPGLARGVEREERERGRERERRDERVGERKRERERDLTGTGAPKMLSPESVDWNTPSSLQVCTATHAHPRFRINTCSLIESLWIDSGV